MTTGSDQSACSLFGSDDPSVNSQCLREEIAGANLPPVESAILYAKNNRMHSPIKVTYGDGPYLNCVTFTNDVIEYLLAEGYDASRLNKVYSKLGGINHVSVLVDNSSIVDVNYGEVSYTDFTRMARIESPVIGTTTALAATR